MPFSGLVAGLFVVEGVEILFVDLFFFLFLFLIIPHVSCFRWFSCLVLTESNEQKEAEY